MRAEYRWVKGKVRWKLGGWACERGGSFELHEGHTEESAPSLRTVLTNATKTPRVNIQRS